MGFHWPVRETLQCPPSICSDLRPYFVFIVRGFAFCWWLPFPAMDSIILSLVYTEPACTNKSTGRYTRLYYACARFWDYVLHEATELSQEIKLTMFKSKTPGRAIFYLEVTSVFNQSEVVNFFRHAGRTFLGQTTLTVRTGLDWWHTSFLPYNQ